MLVITTDSFNGTLHENLGVRIGALLWIADFRPTAPNCLEARRVDVNSTEGYRLHKI